MTELSFQYENGQNIKHASLVTDEAKIYILFERHQKDTIIITYSLVDTADDRKKYSG